jgi:uncharacterized membrane protein YkoI
MKASVKLLVALALLGTASIGIVVRNATATQPRSNAVTSSVLNNSNRDISDGDSELNPATEAPENAQLAQSQASDGDGELPDQQEEQQEDAQLRSLARISADQARQSAEAVQQGTVDRITLDNEDGNVVYKVMIAQVEITVDAGNGKVLQVEQASSESEQNDVPFSSSIQVPEPQAGDRELSNGGNTH